MIVCRIQGPCTIFCTVTTWFNKYRRGRLSLEDNTRSGRPSDAVSPYVIAAVEKLIMEDRRTKVLEIVRTMKISCGCGEIIIHDHLKISKVSTRWVPRTPKKPDCSRSGVHSHIISRVLGSLHV